MRGPDRLFDLGVDAHKLIELVALGQRTGFSIFCALIILWCYPSIGVEALFV